jgi:hypothetical protein
LEVRLGFVVSSLTPTNVFPCRAVSLAGVLFASRVSNRFDADPKKFRMAAGKLLIFLLIVSYHLILSPCFFSFCSAYALDLATFIEILTPLVPFLFLPLASVANIGLFFPCVVCFRFNSSLLMSLSCFFTAKNIAWLSASSTRAAIHRSLIRQENMADVTAKAGSQTIAASLVGSLLTL